jgi:hypothetical protein
MHFMLQSQAGESLCRLNPEFLCALCGLNMVFLCSPFVCFVVKGFSNPTVVILSVAKDLCISCFSPKRGNSMLL